MNQVQVKYRRPAIFFSREVQEEAAPGEWVRSDSKSGPRLVDQIDEFSSKNDISITFISNPTIYLADNASKSRTYILGVSILYMPSEIVLGQTERNQNVREPTDITGQLGDELREQIIRKLGATVGAGGIGGRNAKDRGVSGQRLPKLR